MALYRNIFLRKILELDKLVFDVTIHYFERNVEFQLILVDVFKQVIVYWAKFTSKWNIYILKEELYFKKGIRQKWLYSESQAFACFSEKKVITEGTVIVSVARNPQVTLLEKLQLKMINLEDEE